MPRGEREVGRRGVGVLLSLVRHKGCWEAALALAALVQSAEAEDITRLTSSVLWRSSQLEAGEPVVFGSPARLVLTGEGVYFFDAQTQDVCFVSRAGVAETLTVTGEAPGHAFMVADIDVSPLQEIMAVVQGPMPSRTVLRSPLRPPFVLTQTITPSESRAAMRVGVSARVRGDWVATHFTERRISDFSHVVSRISLENLRTGETTTPIEKVVEYSYGQNSPEWWVWALDASGAIFVSDDHNSAEILAISASGNELFRTQLPVTATRKSDEIIELVKESFKPLAELGQKVPVVIEENYRLVENIVCRNGKLFVLTSEGSRRGRGAARSIEWIVLSSRTGTLLERITIELPFEDLSIRKAVFDGDTLIVLAQDVFTNDELELIGLEPIRTGP